MTNLIFVIAALIWAVAAYAFLRVVMAWLALMAMAPAGERVPAAMELGFWNFGALERRLGAQALPAIDRYRRGFYLFFACFIPFFVLTIVSIFLTTAPAP